MSDLAQRLRILRLAARNNVPWHNLADEAATRIEALEARAEQEAVLRYEAGMYQSLYEVAKARIEALEAALRAVLEVTADNDTDVAWLTTLQLLARDALTQLSDYRSDKDASK